MVRASDDPIQRLVELAARAGTCDECGYAWTIPIDDARGIVTNAPNTYRRIIGDHPGARRKPSLDIWSPSAYVWHVSDAIGIWAERLVALVRSSEPAVVPFDPEELARVRHYEESSTEGALWALSRRVADWDTALAGIDPDTEFSHPEFGDWTVGGVIRWIAHEVNHHELDIKRGLELDE